MRIRLVVLSLFSAILTGLLTGILNTITGLPLDVPAAYNAPVRVVPTLLGAAPGFLLGLTASGLALKDAARRGGDGWFIGLLVWPFVPLLVASLMFTGALGLATWWFLALPFAPLAALLYALTSPPAPETLDATPLPGKTVSRTRFSVFAGTLLLVTLGGVALLIISNGNGSVTPGPPVLQVAPSGGVASCASGNYPPITLMNTGMRTVTWIASPQDPNVTSTPASGDLAAGASVTVTLGGATSATDVIVQFQTSGQITAVAKFTCQSGTSK